MNYQTIAGLSPAQLQTITGRFWSYVKNGTPDECWEWQGYVGEYGYGRFRVGKNKQTASRVAFELVRGPIPAGHDVCHKCDNPTCVNPLHLFVGSHRENMQDKVRKGRSGKGEANPQASLTTDQVGQIRRKYQPGKYGCKRLAKEFNTTYQNVWLIVKFKTWQ